MKRHLTTTLLVTGCALGTFGTAMAADRGMPTDGLPPDSVQIQSVTVPYDAAELRDERGAERLFFRIRQAAAEVCDMAPHEAGYERWEEHACETAAVSEAVQDVGEPALIEYYSDLGGSVQPEETPRR